jgi:hypothetical protein
MRTKKAPAVASVALALGAGVLVGAPAATASGDDDGEVRVSGQCSGSADWKLKAKRDDGRIEWEFEVDSNRAGQKWRVRVRDNGALLMRGTRATRPPSGSFEVERKTANKRGTDHFVARAQRGKNGQVCVGRLNF